MTLTSTQDFSKSMREILVNPYRGRINCRAQSKRQLRRLYQVPSTIAWRGFDPLSPCSIVGSRPARGLEQSLRDPFPVEYVRPRIPLPKLILCQAKYLQATHPS